MEHQHSFLTSARTNGLKLRRRQTVGERAHVATPDDYFQQPRKSSLRKPGYVSTQGLRRCWGVLFALPTVITESNSKPYTWKPYRI